MIGEAVARAQSRLPGDARVWMLTAALFAAALAVALTLMPVWGWAMVAAAPLLLFVHRGEIGGRVAGNPLLKVTKPAAAAPVSDTVRLAQSLAGSRSASCGIAVLDCERRVVWCNDKSASHLGFRSGSTAIAALGALGYDIPSEDDLRSSADSDQKRDILRTADGRTISVQWLPFIDSDWLLLSRDVTGREQAEAVQRNFVADASHELRNPLTVMMGLLETVTELDLDKERCAYYFQLMEQQGRRMQSIVEGLLKLSRLESMPSPTPDDRVDMGLLLSRIRAEAEILSCGRHSITLDADSGISLLGSEHEISSAVGNLVSNAIRYTLPGGEIRIVWRSGADGATLAVEDTGIGIEPDHIPLLTKRFYRVDHSRDNGGTGLGLSIVNLVLQRHEAKLEIASQPGKGSRFAIRFPASRVLGAFRTKSEQRAPVTAL
jgi:two-component system, OmpR family, phosphate regulon sensor histidine kinase PhoR